MIVVGSEIKDFTEVRAELRKFKVDDDIFECASVLPAGAATFMAEMAQADGVKQVIMLSNLLDMIILPGSAERFAERIKDPVNPISSGQLGNIIRWLFEEYGDFPTQQSSTSAPGLTSTGTPSTAGVQPAA